MAAGSETPRAPEQRAAAQLREGFRERLGETIDTTGKLIAALASLGILFFATGYFVEWQRLKRGELPPEEILPLIPQEQIPAAGVRELVVSLVFVMLLLAAFGFARSRLAASSRVGRVRPGHVSRWDLALPALIVGLVTFLFAPLHADGIVVSLTLGGLTYYSFRLLYGYLAAVARARKAPPTADSGREDASPKFPLLRLTIAIFVAAIILSGARQREFPNPRAKVTVVLNTEAKIHGVFLGINADKVLVRVQRPPLGPRLIVLRSSEVKQIRIRKGAEFLTGGAPDSAFDETIGRLFDARFTCIPPECWAGYDTRVGPSSFF